MNKGLTMKMGQTHMQRYMKPLLQKVEAGEIDPSFVITHRLTLDDAPGAYKTFRVARSPAPNTTTSTETRLTRAEYRRSRPLRLRAGGRQRLATAPARR